MPNQFKRAASSPTAHSRRVATPADLSAELSRLSCLSIDDLKLVWTKTFNGAAPKNARRDYLLRAVAHELQCKTHGGIAKSLLRTLIKAATSDGGLGTSDAKRSRVLKAGVRLYREWKGTLHEVEVIEGGYRYEGKAYRTLSVIARQITGTRWSGPVFFGVKRDTNGGGNGR